MIQVFLLACITSALYYLFAHAKVTRFLWIRYPFWLDELVLCPWCSGTWYGAGVGVYFRRINYHFISRGWDEVFVCAMLGLVLTPIVCGLAFFFYSYIPQKGLPEPEAEEDGPSSGS